MISSKYLSSLFLLSLFAFHVCFAVNIKLQSNDIERILQRGNKPPAGGNQGSSSSCASSCGSHGTCDGTSKQCVCDNGYFNEDCSVSGYELVADLASGSIIPSGYGIIYYLDLSNESNDLTLNVEYAPTTVDIYMKFASFTDSEIPNEDNDYYELPEDQTSWKLTISKKNIKANSDKRLVILIANDDDAIVKVIIEPTFSSISILVPILIGIGTVTVFIFLMILCCAMRRRRQLAEEGRRVPRNVQAENGEDEEENIQQRAVQGNHSEAVTYLTEEELNKFFPEGNFCKLKSQFAQQSCSICLEDFRGEDVCRQLYCVHIFHSQCIQLWLKKHQDCPNCKKEMTRDAIKENLEMPQTKELKNSRRLNKSKNEGRVKAEEVQAINNA